jgi:hypothetical protein
MSVREALGKVASGLRPKISDGATRYQFCGKRYAPQTDPDHLTWMLDQVEAHLQDWPTDKISRWIGFIQGVLAAHGWLNVDEERDRTRPLFHQAYKEEGLKIPETVEND